MVQDTQSRNTRDRVGSLSRVPLAKTGLQISRLGLGAGTQANLEGPAAFDRMLEHAWEAGLQYLDTAPMYLAGESERRVGSFLSRRPHDEIVVSTKVGRLPDPAGSATFGGERRFDYSAEATQRSIEASLERLGRDKLDMVAIHDVDRKIHGNDFAAIYAQALDGCYPVLDRLRAAGVIKAIGLSSRQTDVCLRAVNEARFDFVMMAGSYTLLNHEPLDDLLPFCSSSDIGVLIASPFNSGILATGSPQSMFQYAPPSDGVVARVQKLVEIGARYEVKIADAALQFPLFHPSIASVVVGHRSPEEVERNIAGLTAEIPPDYWLELKSAGLIPDRAPTEYGAR